MVRLGWSGLLALFFAGVAQAAPKPGELPYYGAAFFAAPSNGAALKEALFRILSDAHEKVDGDFDRISASCTGASCARHTALGYNRAREFLLGDFYLVRDKSGFGVRDVYCERVVPAEAFPGRKPGPNEVPDGTVVNTEHTWPQSRFPKGFPQDLQKSDLHHLFPTDSQVNGDRSSHEFGDVRANAKGLKCTASKLGLPANGQQLVFEPPLSHKGNVARALFYFSVRYRAPLAASEESTLREWNRLDPVDAEEKARNQRIFELQRNRNPFVDYPELADRIADF